MVHKVRVKQGLIKPPCPHPLSSSQSFILIIGLIGLSTIVGLVLMTIIFVAEQIETMPFLGIFYIESLSLGENWIMFMWTFIGGLFIGFLILWGFYHHYRIRRCQNLEAAFNQLPGELL